MLTNVVVGRIYNDVFSIDYAHEDGHVMVTTAYLTT